MHPAAGLPLRSLLFLLFPLLCPLLFSAECLLLGCAANHPLGADWQELAADEREARAIETVRSVLAERGPRVPGTSGTPENRVLLVDRRLAIYRPVFPESSAGPPPGPLAVLQFEDILRLERRVRYDLPGQPEDLSIYLRRNSPSVWAIGAPESLLSPLLSRVGLEGPVLLLPQRPQRTYWRLKPAIEHLLSLPRSRQGVGVAVQRILRQSVEEDRDRDRFESEVLAVLNGSP